MAQRRSSRAPRREEEYTEEEVYEEEEVYGEEEEMPLIQEAVQTVVQETGGLNEEEVPLMQEEAQPVVQDTEVKTVVESKNGKKMEGGGGGGGGPKYSMFTWFVVLALLGVWSSVAVVYFDIVDYDSVIARAKEFHVNFSEVLQGKLTAYDTDGDGDFDMEDAKVLLDDNQMKHPALRKEKLNKEDKTDVKKKDKSREDSPGETAPGETGSQGLKDPERRSVGDPPVDKAGTNEHTPEAKTSNEQAAELKGAERAEATSSHTPAMETETAYGSHDVESDIQAAVPLPAFVEEDFVADDPRGDSGHPYDEADTIDTTGVLVEEAEEQETVVESAQYLTSSRLTHETESVLEAELQAKAVVEPEIHFSTEPQTEPSVIEPQTEAAVEASSQTEPSEPKMEPSVKPESQAGSTSPEAEGTTDRQAEEKLTDKVKKKKPKMFNKLDKTIRAEIDAAEKLRKKGKVEEALRAFDSLVQQYPQSPRARYGKAQCEDDLAEKLRSNDLLQKAISTYRDAAELPAVTSDLLRASLKRRAHRQQFLGRMRGSLATLERLVQIFPEDLSLKNDLGVAHLLLGDNKGAKKVYEEVLAVAPGNGFAKVHYGFILKSENKIAESIPYLKEGLQSGEPGTDDGRFYFHLGDALQRVGDDSAYSWYELGHQRGHFASVWQRSLYNVEGLKAQPWWTAKETGYTDLVKTLERNWRSILEEGLAVMDQGTNLFIPEEENLRERGQWGQYTLWQQGRKVGEACRSVPKTCSLLDRYPEATGCKRGQIKFSVMQPGTHVWPHTGPTNCRLRMHLGLVIPKQGCSIRCTNQTRYWEEGKVLIFDDSFEHEVWQDADSYRLIFIVDVWHPELTASQRQTLSPI